MKQCYPYMSIYVRWKYGEFMAYLYIYTGVYEDGLKYYTKFLNKDL